MDNNKLLDFVNQSGFPLQIAIANSVNSHTAQHGWKVLYTEHAWSDVASGDAGFIDLVLEDEHQTSVLVLECKRVLDSTWVFLQTETDLATQADAKLWINFASSNLIQWWLDMSNNPASPQSSFCVVPGQDAKSKPMLERVAAEVVSATKALAMEEGEHIHLSKGYVRAYASVIVTTAGLKIGRFSPGEISIEDGKLQECAFQDVDFVRFRKQLSTNSEITPSHTSYTSQSLAVEKEHTVFVVTAKALNNFLADWTIHPGPIHNFTKRFG